MKEEVKNYNQEMLEEDKRICNLLFEAFESKLYDSEHKVWHGHPVWFLDGNPVVGYSKQKSCIQLLFWSGQSFETKGLIAIGKFKAAGIKYTSVNEINIDDLNLWLKEAENIQWDYKNIVKNKGVLNRLK